MIGELPLKTNDIEFQAGGYEEEAKLTVIEAGTTTRGEVNELTARDEGNDKMDERMRCDATNDASSYSSTPLTHLPVAATIVVAAVLLIVLTLLLVGVLVDWEGSFRGSRRCRCRRCKRPSCKSRSCMRRS
jgi:hypothetical protein